MKIGFTGTQKGMTVYQRETFNMIISRLDIVLFHHGDCIKSDEEAHNTVDEMINNDTIKGAIIIHPPINNSKRAYCKTTEVYMRKPKPYLERNKDIVDKIEMLIATPKGDEIVRSGTWATIRYARKKHKKIIIIKPNGNIIFE